MAGLCHCILCKDTDQFSAACLLAYDGLHDELPKGSALNAVNTEGYRNDEFKAIHIIADAVVLPDMTAYTLLFQNAVLASLLGRYQDDTIGTTSTIDSRAGR